MKTKIYEYIVETTLIKNYHVANAKDIASKLKLSRNLVSQYLNEYFGQGRFIKINSRPVLFIDVLTIEKMYHIHLSSFIFHSLEEFEEMIEKEKQKDFEYLIGYDESLQTVVDTCKATISYPPKGLPFLLCGPTGTGKSRIATTTYEYCVHQGLIEKDKSFYILNCSEYANNPELLAANLFGHKKGAYTGADKDNPGLLKLAEDSILFLDEVHCLKAECQEKLFLFMDKGIYHMVGDNEHWYQSNARLIFATTEDPKKCLLKTLLRRIPMIIHVPSLQERGMKERVQLIYTIFKEEGKRLNKRIALTNSVYTALAKTDFVDNIGDLKNCIQASCVHAYYKSSADESRLLVDSFDLPANFIQIDVLSDKSAHLQMKSTIIELDDLLHIVRNERAPVKLNHMMLEAFSNYQVHHDFDDFLSHCFRMLDDYYNLLIEKDCIYHHDSFNYVQSLLKYELEVIADKYGVYFHKKDLEAITTYFDDYTRYKHDHNIYSQKHKAIILKLLGSISNQLHREYMIALDVLKSLRNQIDLHIDELGLCLLTIYLKKFNQFSDWNKRVGLILTHGYGTASSIADAVNRMLDQYIFDAIDMPIDTSTNQIIDQINHHLLKMGNFEELVLLVDMGSLEEIDKGIHLIHNVKIGLINNVSTKMALEIGSGICQGLALGEIFSKVIENGIPAYHIISKHNQE